MRKKFQWRKASGLTAGFALVLCLNAVAEESELALSASQPVVAGEAGGPSEMAAKEMAAKKANDTRSGRGVFIIQLEDPALASYRGGISDLQPTSLRVTGGTRLDTNSKSAKSYKDHLKTKQAGLIKRSERSMGRPLDVKFTYQHAINGMAVELSEEEAAAMAKMPGVKSVERERMEVPLTDVGPQWINAPAIWDPRSRKSTGSKGEGVVIGVLDSGINFDHPSFSDIGGDGYDHTNPLGSGNYLPGSYCDTTDASFCNDKLIGAYTFVPGDAQFPSPEADDGHGVHTTSTAGGNVVQGAAIVAPTTTFTRDVSGVAPHANIIAYDVCIVSCPGSALVAALNQVIIDSGNLPNGIAAINYSISGGANPYSDAVELAFLAAADAGIFVSASAGNSGPGAGTVAHLSPWIATVAASTHNRSIDNSLVGLSSDAAGLGDILGAGLTSGYGPAPIVHARDYPTANGSQNDTDPGQCLDPFPPGTFSGEIVICDRGAIARVAKGANVLSGGAGGFVLANLAANGESVVADPHFLPGVHIGASAALVLDAWLTSNANTVATISGYDVNLDSSNGDVMAGFSSRGPSGAFDVLKPDVTAPGVNIMAALDSLSGLAVPEFGFLSGTSMSSPHNAGAAALVKAVRPDWSPHQIKSAMMMTATTRNTVKEDGVTPTDHFDLGAGRIDLSRVADAGLVLDETTANFLAADPGLGGDPKTLNIASMQNSNCVEECSWTRTVENVSGSNAKWKLRSDAPAGLEITTDPKNNLKLKKGSPGESKTITVTANTALAAPGWNFATLELDRAGNKGPDLHMPIAVFASGSSNPGVLSKTVDAAEAAEGEPLNYQIDITNGQLTGTINLSDVLPSELEFVPGSETEVVTNGTTSSPFSYAGGALSWSGELDPSGFGLTESPSPFGYFSLASLGVSPFALPSNCDDGAWIINVPSFNYKGVPYSQVIWSVNGTLEAGTASGLATSFANQDLPNPSLPNNLMAPWWTDLNLCSGGNWYVAGLSAGPNLFTVFEWENVPRFGNLAETATFQIWIVDGTDQIWFVYGPGGVQGVDGTVGVENSDGTVGEARYYDGAGIYPAAGVDLMIEESIGGTASFTFQAEIDKCKKDEAIVNRVNVSTADASETAIAATRCIKDDDDSSD